MLIALLALGAAAMYGVSDYSTGSAARRLRVLPATSVTYACAAAAVGAAVALDGGAWTAGAVLWGALSGVAAIIGFLAFYAAMAAGPMSLVSPAIAALQSLVPAAIAIVLGRHLEWWAWLAVAFVVAGGLLTGWQRSPGDARVSVRTLGLALIAGVALGLSIVTLDAAPRPGRLVPALVELGTGLVLLAGAAVATRASRRARSALAVLDVVQAAALLPLRRAVLVAALSGLLLGVANALLVLALHAGNLAVVGVLVGLYPVATIVLAHVIDKERLGPLQRAGVAVAVLASLALAAA